MRGRSKLFMTTSEFQIKTVIGRKIIIPGYEFIDAHYRRITTDLGITPNYIMATMNRYVITEKTTGVILAGGITRQDAMLNLLCTLGSRTKEEIVNTIYLKQVEVFNHNPIHYQLALARNGMTYKEGEGVIRV